MKHVKKFKKKYLLHLLGLKSQNYYPGMRNAYVESKGSNVTLSRLNRVLHPPKRAAGPSILGPTSPELISSISNTLEEEGVSQLPYKLPKERIERLKQKAKEIPLRPVWKEGVTGPAEIAYSDTPPEGLVTAWTKDINNLLELSEIVELAMDPLILGIARNYLNCEPILDIIHLWWTFPSDEISNASAQSYHFDYDRVKFFKIFCYLLDTDETAGPHAFIRKSHRDKPDQLWKDARIPDSEIFAHIDRQDEVVLTGEAGTLFAEDTAGFHKGMPATAKPRLIFELQYTTDLFGQSYPTWKKTAPIDSMIRSHGLHKSRLFSQFKP